MFSFHKLALGHVLLIKKPDYERTPSIRRESSISSDFSMTPYNFVTNGDIEKKPEFASFKGRPENKSISVPYHIAQDFAEQKIEKAKSIVSRREELNRQKKSGTKSKLKSISLGKFVSKISQNDNYIESKQKDTFKSLQD